MKSCCLISYENDFTIKTLTCSELTHCIFDFDSKYFAAGDNTFNLQEFKINKITAS